MTKSFQTSNNIHEYHFQRAVQVSIFWWVLFMKDWEFIFVKNFWSPKKSCKFFSEFCLLKIDIGHRKIKKGAVLFYSSWKLESSKSWSFYLQQSPDPFFKNWNGWEIDNRINGEIELAQKIFNNIVEWGDHFFTFFQDNDRKRPQT